MQRYYLTLDLKDDPALIAAYEQHHQRVWPEVEKSISDAAIVSMEIYRAGNRLFMILNTLDSFSFEKKAQMDEQNEKVQQWESLMWKFQQPLPFAKEGEKWVLMKQIYQFNHQ